MNFDIAKYYVYVFFRPNGVPLYVGKGKGSRWKRIDAAGSRNIHFVRIAEQSARLGLELPVVKIRENLTEDQAFEIERIFIAAIGREPNGPLVNLTDGGEGISGHIHSAQSREKIRFRSVGKNISEKTRRKISEAQIGLKKPVGHGQRVSKSLTGRSLSKETKEKISAAMIGRKFPNRKSLSSEAKEHLRRINIGKKASDETRAKMSASQFRAWEARR